MGGALMSVEWGSYELYELGFVGPFQDLPRVEARAEFARIMAAKGQRIEMLRGLLKSNGVELAPGADGIQNLNDWFRHNVEHDPARADGLLPEWYSVSFDIGLFLGEVLIGRHPNLHWEYFTWGKKNVSYQRPVIMGFSSVQNPKYNIDFWSQVETYGQSIVHGRGPKPVYGTTTVRGVALDIDAIVAEAPRREPPKDRFWNWIVTLDSEA